MRHSDSGQSRRNSKGRARRQPYAWLGAGAVTLGLGAALVGGSAVACADTGAGAGSGTAHSARHNAATSSSAKTSSRNASAAAASNATAAAVADTEATETQTTATSTPGLAHSALLRTTTNDTSAAASDSSSSTAATSTPSSYSWLPSTPPTVADVAVNLAQSQITSAQSLLQQQTWGSGNFAAGLVAIAPQILLSQAALALSTWEIATPKAQSLYANTSGVPIVHELAGVSLLGALLLPTLATTALTAANVFLPLVGAFEGTSSISPIQNLVTTAAQNGRVYGVVLVSMKSTTEPIVYISINGGPSTPVLVDTGSSGLVVTSASVGDAAPLGPATGTGTSGYSGGLSYGYTTYTTTVDFGNGIVSGPTSVNIVDPADAAAALAFFHQLGGASGVLGIGANSAGPGPSLVTTSLPGDLSQGVFLYQSLFLGIAGVMVFGPNPLPTRTSVSGSPDAYLQVKINNGSAQNVGAIIDSGGVYGTILSSMIGYQSSVPVGTQISVYTSDGVLLYSYIVTSQNAPTVISSGLINTGYAPYQHGPVYIDYTYSDNTTPYGQGSTNFDYA
ncbi:PecA family PE domain-processing aspartic protease [Mycolicibacterium sphagni]|uniref:PecA family PE domain-processing aspartic protease n=1 Tax=Mycolicibacterium sphagni TaxID=1786 RepID=UPI0021F341CC|nr:PecA family PE domain-processing aspartic protease [Mycolicibacterium sphagni]MCV7176689.1 PecA family PE domain-processing aspartic protease [Mycolicibacterium sphagni]